MLNFAKSEKRSMLSKITKSVKILILSIILGIIVGLVDAIIDAIFFYNNPVLEEVFHPSTFEIYIRSFILMTFLSFGVFASRIISKLQKSERVKEEIIRELKNAQEEIKVLKGYLPICASCKKIRDDNGYWHELEQYITDHSDAHFSHGLCPECLKKSYEDLGKLK